MENRPDDKSSGEPEPRRKKTQGVFRENFEAVLIAIVLALIIRHFAMEAFVIPTGSMAPTLLGEHTELNCTHCGYEFPVEWSQFKDGRSLEDTPVLCPNCRNKIKRHKGGIGGHKILVNKYIYKFRKPRRWEIIVFRKPGEKETNYIKRLVGLPGEKIKITDGDVFINQPGMADNEFYIARKPRSVQEAMWQHVWNMDYEVRSQNPDLPWLTENEESGEWEVRTSHIIGKSENESYISFIRDIWEYNAYTLYSQRGTADEAVYDVCLDVNLKPLREGGRAVLRINDNGSKGAIFTNEFKLTVPVQGSDNSTAVLYRNGDKVKTFEQVLPVGRGTRVRFAHADQEVWVRIGGCEVVSYKYNPKSSTYDSTSWPLYLGVKNGKIEFTHVRVRRDVYYTSPGVYPNGYAANDTEYGYFGLGDNSQKSEDSRSWGLVPPENMVGKAFMVFYPLDEIKIIK